MKENISCTNCAASIHWLEVFPDDYCLACHAEREESKPLPTPQELAAMLKRSINI